VGGVDDLNCMDNVHCVCDVDVLYNVDLNNKTIDKNKKNPHPIKDEDIQNS